MNHNLYSLLRRSKRFG